MSLEKDPSAMFPNTKFDAPKEPPKSDNKAEGYFPNTNFSNMNGIDPQVARRNSDISRYMPVELLDEPSVYNQNPAATLTVKAGEVGPTIVDRLRTAFTAGRLHESLGHWIGTLDGLELVDKGTIKTLKDLRTEITGYRNTDDPILAKLEKIFYGLTPRKR